MLEGYKIFTITHKDTDLSNLENFVVRKSDDENPYQKVREAQLLFETPACMYLATCNRVMYFFHTNENTDNEKLRQFFAYLNPSLESDSFFSQFKVFDGKSAIDHLFEVSASMDSLVVGEREILRQLRAAYYASKEVEITDDNIRIAYKKSVVCAKSIYSDTKIGEKPVSVVSLAIQELKNTFVQPQHRFLIVGAGQTNSLVAKFLKKNNYENVIVFNRTTEKAQKVAAHFGNEFGSFDDLSKYDSGFDCLIVCTGKQNAWVSPELVNQWAGKSPDSPKVIIDLSIPHNVKAEIGEQEHITHIEIDGLKKIASKNLAFRSSEVSKGKEIAAYHFEEFKKEYQGRLIVRALQNVPVEVKEIKHKALDSVFKKELENLDSDTVDLIEKMMTYMEKKCISIPIKAARSYISDK